MQAKSLKNYLITGLITGLLIFSVSSAGQNSIPDFPPENVVLLFNSGFEPGSRVIHRGDPFTADDNIVGIDSSVPPPNNWNTNVNLGSWNFQYQQGDTTQRKLRIVPDPVNPENNVLSFWVRDQWVNAGGNTVGRIQANLRTPDDGNVNGIKELYQKNKMFVHEDVAAFNNYLKTGHFFTFLEIWNTTGWEGDPYRFRIAIGIGKARNESTGDICFVVTSQDGDGKYVTVWEERNSNIPVPIGEWVTMEYYMKDGDAQNGHFYMAMTREDGTRREIVNVRNFTYNTKNPNSNGITFYNPLKVYITDTDAMAFLKSHNKSIHFYFDDFEVWGDRSPPVTPPDLRPLITGVAKITDNINGFAEASSTKSGTIYLVKYGLNAVTQAELDSLVNANLGRKVNVFEAGIPVIIYTKGLPGGYYQFYAVDMENRVSFPSTAWVSIDQTRPVTGLDTPIFKQSFSAWQQNRQIIVDPGNDQSYSLDIYTITGQLFYQGKNLSGIQSVDLDGTRGVLIITKQSETGTSAIELVVN